MKLKPLAPSFDSEQYLKNTLKTIESTVEWLRDRSRNEYECPALDVQKDYANYYKKAIVGKLTKEVIDEHQADIYKFVHPFDVNISDKRSNTEDLGGSKNFSTPHIGRFNIFITLRPLLNQFYLFAALSNSYLKQDDLLRSFSYAMNAADTWGSIRRLPAELINAGIVEAEITTFFQKHEEIKSEYKKISGSKGGIVKGENSREWANASWLLCSRDPQYEILFKKYSGKGRKFSDSLFDLLKQILKSKEMKEVPYGSSWFYEEVFLKFKQKEIKTYLT